MYNCCCEHHQHGYGRVDYRPFKRRFINKEEEIKGLVEYEESLRQELAGVEEELKKLKELNQ